MVSNRPQPLIDTEQDMQIEVVSHPVMELETDTLIIPLFEDAASLGSAADETDRALDGMIRSLIETREITGKFQEMRVLYPLGALPVNRVIVAGLGKGEALTQERCRRVAGTAAGKAKQIKSKELAFVINDVEIDAIPYIDAVHAVTEGILMGSYQSRDHKSIPAESEPISKVQILSLSKEADPAVHDGVRTGQIFADAACTARDLVNQPGNHMTPQHLARVAEAIAMSEGMKFKVLEESELESLGMGALLGVSRGSEEACKFIILEHTGEDPDDNGAEEEQVEPPCVVLIGKGITFDSGGLSLKPRDKMMDMKTDMAGAAVVIAAMQGVARLKLRKRVIALAPASENLPSGTACKPGDVLAAMNGKTIEVLNTDAEGRLILADALCYADQFKPSAVIDVATLTGACTMALGADIAAAIFATDDGLCNDLIGSGEEMGERFWRLPLYDEYKDLIKSDVADMKNTGGLYGGVGTSAIFLKEFVSYPWAHLDIASMAVSKKKTAYTPKGATGFAVRTLLQYLS